MLPKHLDKPRLEQAIHLAADTGLAVGPTAYENIRICRKTQNTPTVKPTIHKCNNYYWEIHV